MMTWHSCDSGVNVSKNNPGDHEVSSLSRGKKKANQEKDPKIQIYM